MKTVMMFAMTLTVLASSNSFAARSSSNDIFDSKLDPNAKGLAAQASGEAPCPYQSVVKRNAKTDVIEKHAAATTKGTVAQ